LVDLDGDGIPDLITGSWPGEIYFFKGQGKGQFAAPVKLRNTDGKLINPGGGVRKKFVSLFPPRVDVQVTGDGTWETTDKGAVIVYDGERIPVPDGSFSYVTGTASAVHAVDWNGDGAIDLLIGDIGGNVYLVPNEGTPKKWAFGKERQLKAGGKDLVVEGGDAGPFACDWDGDGKIDLLVGAGDGSVWFFRNIGTGKEPELAAGVRIVGPGDITYGPDAPKEPRRGVRAKVCAMDWSGAGRLDLLVGDITNQRPDRPEPTAAEKAEHDKVRKELETIQPRFYELIGRLRDKPPTGDARKKLDKELTEVQEKMTKLREKIPPEYESHGWVWLFRRKPPAAAAAP
jgi:hypothetical protein